jgi:transcriptional regulator NrdR family protein
MRRRLLPCPETCSKCGGKSFVQDTRRTLRGYRFRKRICPDCGNRWPTYETVIHPRVITIRVAAPSPAPSPEAPPPPSPGS